MEERDRPIGLNLKANQCIHFLRMHFVSLFNSLLSLSLSSWTILMSPFQVAKETLFFVVQKHTWALPETLDQIFDERVSNWIDTLIKSYSIALLDLVGEKTNNCAWPLLCVLFFLGFAGENLGSELLRLRFVGLKRTLCFFKCNPTNFQSAVTFLPAFLKRFNITCSIPPFRGNKQKSSANSTVLYIWTTYRRSS